MILLLISYTLILLPDIIIVHIIEFLFWPSTHQTYVPFLSVVIVKLKLVVSPGIVNSHKSSNKPNIWYIFVLLIGG